MTTDQTLPASQTGSAKGMERAPRSGTDRFHVLDALRGFALLGIFLANIRFFAGWEFAGQDLRLDLAGGYLGAYEALEIIFVDGKFYTLFSLLFGIGFSLQLSRLKTAGPGAVSLYLRRLMILLGIGLIHLFCIWFGDILTPYALLGIGLLVVRDWSDKAILRLAALCFMAPFAGHLLFMLVDASPDLGLYQVGFGIFADSIPNFQGDMLSVLQSDTWSTFFSFNNGGGVLRFGYLFESWRLFKLAFVMLIGLWVGRRIVAGTFFENTALLKRVALIGFGVGLPMSIVYAKLGVVFAFAGPPTLEGFWRLGAYMFSVFPLGIAYGAGFALLWRSHSRMLSIFAAPGRMALTNYLAQSAVGIAIFYGVGLGLAGKTPPAVFVLIALGIYAAQILLSTFWLKYFKYGPAEWLWRCATYGRVLSIRKTAVAAG